MDDPGRTPPQARLYVLLARASARAVVFRRGPSKSVLMIAWDRETDRFEEGQWLRGRLYERRCDLSPSGALLVYFAAKYRRYLSAVGEDPDAFATWTAVSRPPFFTALGLWPQDSGAWNGGGLFEDERTLLLNHGSRVPPCGGGTTLPPPSTLEVRPLGGPHGEDDTVQHPRLLRDGWQLVEPGRSLHVPDGDPHFVFDPPRVYARPQPGGGAKVLRRTVRGLGSVNGPWYVEDHEVDRGRAGALALEGAEWADWDRQGDLLFARRGALFRLGRGELHRGVERALGLADFADRTFENRPPPRSATRW